MSEFLQQPEFEGNSEFKDLIDGMFKEQPKPERKPKEEPPAPAAKKRRRIKFPEPPKRSGEQMKQAVIHASAEMEDIRQAFLDFQDAISDTVVYSYLFPQIEEFAEACKDMMTLIQDDIDLSKLSEAGLENYNKMEDLRRRLLSSVYEKYEE